MKLIIKHKDWSCWTGKNTTSEVQKWEFDVKKNENYIIKRSFEVINLEGEVEKKEREIFSFNVVEIHSSNIKIHTSIPFFSIQGTKQDFIVDVDNILNLQTPTRDSGEIVHITLIK